jgi:hypothetical protein
MLDALRIKNFKPFGAEQRVPLAPITLIYGPNSAGKSSIIQALLFLKQSVEGKTCLPRGRYVDLGSFRALVHKHRLNEPVELTPEFRDLPEYFHIMAMGEDPPFLERTFFDGRDRFVRAAFGLEKGDGARRRTASLREIEFSEAGRPGLKTRFRRHSITPKEMASAERSRPLTSTWRLADRSSARSLARYAATVFAAQNKGESTKPLDTEWLATKLLDEQPSLNNLVNPQFDVGFPRPDGRLDDFGPPRLSGVAGPSRIAQYLQVILSRVSYIGPLRAAPTRHQILSGVDAADVGVHGEHTLDLMARREGWMHAERDVTDWFSRLGIPFRVRIQTFDDQAVGETAVLQLIDKRSRAIVTLADVGFGTGQLLPVIVQALLGGPQVLCVEQPEIHLHPRLQAEVADLLVETSRVHAQDDGDTVHSTQWIVETHSEALMLRVQRRIREKRLPHDAVSVVYVDAGPRGSRARQLRLDERGEFVDEWPDGFFEERYTELMEE